MAGENDSQSTRPNQSQQYPNTFMGVKLRKAAMYGAVIDGSLALILLLAITVVLTVGHKKDDGEWWHILLLFLIPGCVFQLIMDVALFLAAAYEDISVLKCWWWTRGMVLLISPVSLFLTVPMCYIVSGFKRELMETIDNLSEQRSHDAGTEHGTYLPHSGGSMLAHEPLSYHPTYHAVLQHTNPMVFVMKEM